MNETDGVILVFNPDTRGSDQLLNDWFDFFVKKNGLREDQSMIFAHRSNPTGEKVKPRKCLPLPFCCNQFLFISYLTLAAPLFSRVSASVTSPQSGPDMKLKFENFIKDLSSSRYRK